MTRPGAAVFAALLLFASRASAQQPDSLPGLRMRLRADTLRLELPGPLRDGGRLAPRRSPAEVADRWADSTRAHAYARVAAIRRALLLGDTTALAAAVPEEQGPLSAPPEPQERRGMQVLGQYAELGIRMNALLEMRFDRLRNLRCTATDAGQLGSGCRGGFTPPRIDPQFNVQTGGIVGQRIHVNVDYDTQREFDASNNISVYYQGLEDEVLRRVEVGNVTFTPPPSRFITGGIPANNFGVAAQAQLGALEIGGLFAQQKGNVVKARIFSVGNQTVQPVDRVAGDRDFEPQRFFFVRNPRTIPGYPAIDVLNFSTAGLPDSIRVTQVRIYRNRSTVGRPVTETNLTGIQAVALRGDSPQRVGPVPWETLVEGRDYYLDPSALWFALTSRIDQDDHLAVSYVTAAGDTVGTFPATSQAGRVDTLELIYAPRTGADVPTFFYEMRNAYRVGSSTDIDRASVRVELLVAGSARPPSGAATFLDLLGLAVSTDPTSFDQYNRLFPRSRDPAAGAPLRDYFVVLPHLTPFADSVRLTPQFRTDSLYRTPIYLLRTQGPSPLWQVTLHYDSKGGDNRSTLALGGYQIRAGSERVVAAGRLLQRNVEYTINYEIGQVTFLNPDSLFPQPTQVSVQFEENQAFAVAPTAIYGLTARYDLGEHGSISAIGLLQNQRTLFTRPPLGFEPASNAVMGVAGSFHFEPRRLTRLLDALPLVRTEAPSILNIDAEIASSRPSPNQVGVAYVETFEGEGGFFLPLTENTWEYGSRPSSINGVPPAALTVFDDADAAALTWQNLIPVGTVGNETFQLRSQDIDPSIVVQGAGQAAETVMWLALHPDSVGGLPDPRTFLPRWRLPHTIGPRWRSISQPLSATGIDLSRIEYLEFWVLDANQDAAQRAGLTMVLDFGTVFEDAVAFQPTALSHTGADTTFSGRRRAGEGRLDTERDTLTASFNAAINDVGTLGDVVDSIVDSNDGSVARNAPLCQSPLGQGLRVFEWGSFFPHCTRRNGAADAEDLNNDQHLDTLIAAQNENLLRYVVRVGDPRYFVRDGGTVPGVGLWKLYRIPFRSDTAQVGLPDLRQVRALRMTVIAPQGAEPESTLFFALARMRLLGAPWVKRAGTPIAGLAGQSGLPHGEVIASVVSTENRLDLGYDPPPGVTDEGQNVGGGQITSSQINERSLRLIGNDVRTGERAEAYFRFPDGERNFLGYRELRVWARGRGSDWDANRLSFYIKVAQDENNFYLYRQPLRTATWLPEAVVDFREWFALRALIEQRFLGGEAPSGAAACGGDTLAYVACRGPYVVHVRNPAVAPPNLTRVQELAVGFIRDSAGTPDSSELWVDDIRLSQVVNDRGFAGAVSLALNAADVADVNVSLSRRDGNFRQLGENPAYTGTNQLSLASTIRLEKLGLERLGLAAPLTLRLDRSSQDPFFLGGTDVLAEGLGGLRTPRSASTSWGLSLRRTRRGTAWWQRTVTDNLAFAALWSSASTRSELATATSRLSDVTLGYQVQPAVLSVPYLPGFLRSLLDGLPGFLRNGDMVRGLRDGRLRVTPASLSFSSGMTRTHTDRSSFRVPIATPFDAPLPVQASTAVLRAAGGIELRPFQSMSVGLSTAWDRDLKDYGDSTTLGALTGQRAQRLLGMDIGFVRQRSLATRLAWSPPIASWIRPRVAWTSDFTLSRDPNAGAPERTDGDSAGAFRLPTTFGNGAAMDLSAAFDLSRLLRGLFGDSSGTRRLLDRVTQLDVSRRIDRRSQFDRPGFDPGTRYILGWGGLGAFRSQGGRLANAASSQRQDRVNLVMRLPLSVALTGTYAQRSVAGWFLRGGFQQVQTTLETEWPNISARWLWSPRGGFLRKVLSSVNAGLGLQTRRSVNEQPTVDAEGEAAGLRFTQQTRARPVSLNVVWVKGIVTTLSRSGERSLTNNVGNLTRGDRTSTAADISASFKPPQDFLPIKNNIRASLRFLHAINALCVERVGAPDCLPIADSRRTEYNLTMDTDMPPSVTAGVSAGYELTEDRHANRKFSQFTLTASVRIFFAAGEIR